MINKVKSTFDNGKFSPSSSIHKYRFCQLIYFSLDFLDARLSNSSTFRGWLESTGLDDILVIDLIIIIMHSINQSSSCFAAGEHL